MEFFLSLIFLHQSLSSSILHMAKKGGKMTAISDLQDRVKTTHLVENTFSHHKLFLKTNRFGKAFLRNSKETHLVLCFTVIIFGLTWHGTVADPMVAVIHQRVGFIEEKGKVAETSDVGLQVADKVRHRPAGAADGAVFEGAAVPHAGRVSFAEDAHAADDSQPDDGKHSGEEDTADDDLANSPSLGDFGDEDPDVRTARGPPAPEKEVPVEAGLLHRISSQFTQRPPFHGVREEAVPVLEAGGRVVARHSEGVRLKPRRRQAAQVQPEALHYQVGQERRVRS